jgi:aminoglycoside phosphotransferase (APT) family kinase protein
MASPAAEIHVDARLVRALLDEQHPDLADLRLLELDAGWDNTLWRLGDALLVRLPGELSPRASRSTNSAGSRR